jgi:hypothetical protein
VRTGMVAGADPTPGSQTDQNQELKPTGRATERCRHRRTCRHTPAHHLGLCVWHHDGKRHSTFANSFALIARSAGVPFRCHDLRHAVASRFLQATGNILALQAILGHRSVQMTMRYAHMVTSRLHQAMADCGAKTGTKIGTMGTVSPGMSDAAFPVNY